MYEWLYNIVIEGLKYIIIGHFFFGYEFSGKKTKYLLLLYPLLIPVVELLGIYNLSYLYKNLWKCLLLLSLFKEEVIEKIKGFFAIWFLIALVDNIILAFSFWRVSISENTVLEKMLIGIFSCVFWGFLAKKALNLQKWTREFWKGLDFFEYMLLLAILLILSFIMGGIQGYLYDELTIFERKFTYVLGLIAVILFIFVCVLFFWTRRSREQLEELNRISMSYLKLQRKYYEDSLRQYEDMRSFRHDINHHIFVMSELSDKDKIAELKGYIRKMAESYETCRSIHTGNFIADCIISHAIKDLQGETFSFEIDGHFPEPFFMEDMDFCILLSNLFENAKEALEKVEGQRLLQLEIKRHEQWQYIILRNNVAQKEIDFTHTSKKEKAYHGYGTQNILRVVEKYGGDVKWQQEGKLVEVRIKFRIKNS